MPHEKSTKLAIRDDRPTALTSSAHGSSLDAIGFNITFLAARNPKLALEAMKLYTLAYKIQKDDPPVPDEDFELFNDELSRIQDGDTKKGQ